MVWKFSGHAPVYQQIMQIIQSAVLTGELSPGQRIPSVRDLAWDAQVNPNTMQHALQELERMGLLVTQSTNGRNVTEDHAIIEKMRQEKTQVIMEEFLGRFAQLGISLRQMIQMLQSMEQRGRMDYDSGIEN